MSLPGVLAHFLAVLAVCLGTAMAVTSDEYVGVGIGAGIALWGFLLGIWVELRTIARGRKP